MTKSTPHSVIVPSASRQENLHARIAQKAYELYEQRGRVEGRDLEHWLEAERLVKEQNPSQN